MTRNFTYLFLAAALATGMGCGDDGGGTDTGTGDTSTGDTSTGDTSTGDTSTGDTGTADTGAPSAVVCQEACTDDADCTISETDAGYTCTGGRCTSSAAGCTDDDSCIATLSGWVTECASADDCPGQVCIMAGFCATAPSDGVTCETLTFEDYETMDIDGETVTVCANTSGVCGDAGFCFVPCADDDACAAPSAPTCDTDTGICGCSDDAHCADVAGASVCIDGTCGCAADVDCDDAPNGDVCMNGVCGCSDATACTGDTAFDGTEFVCE